MRMNPQHATDREQQYKLSKEQQEPSILAWWGSVVMFCNEEVMFPCLDCTLRRMGSSIPGGSMCLLIFASTSNPGSVSSLAKHLY
uniref:Uncharacterized protein n=1 Tax=Anguilla anguilla TaxID=7936 RepID=A0A0E9Y198_ANGAN